MCYRIILFDKMQLIKYILGGRQCCYSHFILSKQILCVLVFYCFITYCHKCSSLNNTHSLISSRFCGAEVQAGHSLALCSVSKCKDQGASWAAFSSRASREECTSKCIQIFVRIQILKTMNRSPNILAGSIGGHSQQGQTGYILCHIALSIFF